MPLGKIWAPLFPYTVSMMFYKSLISLLNGISTFVGYLMPKASLQNNSCGTKQRNQTKVIFYLDFYFIFLFTNHTNLLLRPLKNVDWLQ